MEKNLTPQPPDPHMSSSDEKIPAVRWRSIRSTSAWISSCAPRTAMTTSHWHGQVEVNVPFDGDVEYLINNEVVSIRQGYISLFWACTPHQLTRPGSCRQMAIFNLPMHLFLSWPLGPGAYQQRHPRHGH
ncbi:Melibiose operon regulatory protein [Raoultella terrigena]|uniref:Melibiose operon regulatory protein n=1 Tax=Raoultella terrigena TaxID=577 RepID=A0A4U9D4G3_RAOTE|nr:Melibiose operon regulatory protein [Raoultella terrigena]